jgi:hypothetical protein
MQHIIEFHPAPQWTIMIMGEGIAYESSCGSARRWALAK